MASNEYEVKKTLKKLSAIRGSGTELISVYIPPDFPISEEMGKLKEESGQAGNIKSKSTRQNVQGALDKIIQFLRLYKKAPANGIAIFAGNVSNQQSNPRIEVFTVEPLSQIKSNIYRCDSTFLLEPLEAMMDVTDMYLITVLDGRDATVGILKGSRFELVKKIRSFASSKSSKGGQSAARYERAIEESIDDYYKVVADVVNDTYLKFPKKISGIIVGGPGPNKENFIKSKNLNYQIKVVGVFDTGYVDEHTGVNELLDKSKDVLSKQAAIKERAVMDRFLEEVARGNLATYGYEKVKAALDMDNVAKLLISEDLELTKVDYKCSNCKEEITRVEEGNFRLDKHECGGTLQIMSQSDVIEELLDAADKKGIEMIFIDPESQHGKQLLLGFKGIAAMMRYKR